MTKSDPAVYASAQARSFLDDALANVENEWVREFAGRIQDDDVLALLNYRCSLYEQFSDVNYLETAEARLIIRNCATTTMDHAFADGNVSLLQGAVGLVGKSDDGDDALVRMAKMLANEGAIGLVVGPPGAGKTATTYDVGRVWGAITGGTIIGNSQWDGFDRVVESDREMLEAMAETEGPVLALLDETGQALTSRGSEQAESDRFARALKYIRKKEEGDRYAKRGSVLMVGHTDNDTARQLRMMATLKIQKVSRADPGRVRIYESEGGSDSWAQVGDYHGLTDTRERFREHEPAPFRVELVDEDESEVVDVADVERTKDLTTALRAVLVRGDTYREAEALVDFSNSWVGDRVREWVEGEHRDVVQEDEVDEEIVEKLRERAKR